ncbi:MAG: phosphonate C-P lyase system protein PhnG [Pseudomonadota bacterium]
MSILAKSRSESVLAACQDVSLPSDAVDLRPAEIGGVMVRGRMGATGDAFNLGEMTVTRAAVRLSCGTIGYGYVQGRSADHARTAAIIDALMQTERADEMVRAVLAPLQSLISRRDADVRAKAGSTKVDFFTMVRAE